MKGDRGENGDQIKGDVSSYRHGIKGEMKGDRGENGDQIKGDVSSYRHGIKGEMKGFQGENRACKSRQCVAIIRQINGYFR